MRFGERRQAAVSLFAILVAGSGMLIAAAFTGSTSLAEESTFEINRFTIDGGGEMLSVGGGFELSGTIGQPDAGVLAGGDLTLAGGFWFGQSPGDSNEDGGINLLDYVELNACASGPGSTLTVPSCACFDHDGDEDVDLEDVAEFQRMFSGF
ncbi:MAG: hypothetical protein JSU63_20885 [Phycisphaerales bacterium]|nr:MAG: hypothetical protein JSU63_20885 [Phycisphaerales bacterium]